MSDRNVDELVVVKEFGPEMAGERVGWSAMYNEGMYEGWTSVNIAAATIGDEGAAITYETREVDGEKKILVSHDSTWGFLGLAGVSIAFDTKVAQPKTMREVDVEFANARTPQDGSHPDMIMTKAGASHNDSELMQAKAAWTDSMPGLMGDVKQMMKDESLSEYYPLVYYTANVAFAHEATLKLPKEVGAEDLLMPDGSMQEETKQQIKIAQTMEACLADQVGEDVKMKNNLTAFGSVAPADVPQAFESSRRVMHRLEKGVFTANEQLHAKTGLYLPIGYSFGGRTWPFMNASREVEGEAFGRELYALQNGDADIPRSELEDELAELGRRHTYAKQGRAALSMLSVAEESA